MHTQVPLTLDNGDHFYIDFDKLKPIAFEIEEFLQKHPYMNQSSFAEQIIFPFEIKMNNATEGYLDDLEEIETMMKNRHHKKTYLNQRRIFNLYRGYQMIFHEPPISEENLRYLYHILSEGILEPSEQISEDDLYRDAPVYIHYSSNINRAPDQGVPHQRISEHMQTLFDFIHDDYYISPTASFVKSQVIHFYFVYIHPYFDINGRTSRTLSTWYLCNHENYAFTLFNRNIPFSLRKYYQVIRNAKLTHDLTPFLKYMLEGSFEEMKKEHQINKIAENFDVYFTPLEHQTIFYILSMKGNHTLADFCKFYNCHNPKLKSHVIYERMILPLIEKGILEKGNDTNKHMTETLPNFFFDLKMRPMHKEKKKVYPNG